jgi:N4-gp56 family major capsid protein
MAFKAYQSGVVPDSNTYHMKRTLKSTEAFVIIPRYGMKWKLPRNKGETLSADRYEEFSYDATAATEGVSPVPLSFTTTTVQVTIERYNDLRRVSAKKLHLSPQDTLNNVADKQANHLQNVNELLGWNELIGGTNVEYNSSAHTARTDVDGAVNAGMVRRIVRTLDQNKAEHISKINGGGLNQGTVTSEAAFVALGHTDMKSDLDDMPGFKTADTYGDGKRNPHEYGQIGSVKWVLSPQFTPITDAGATTGSTGMISSGTKVDVYPFVVVGSDAYACVMLQGFEDVEPNILDKADKADPTNEWADVAIAWYFACKRTNENWIVRGEVGVTESP